MGHHLHTLLLRHCQPDRTIDTAKTAGKQEDRKAPRRIRLRLKDKITALGQDRASVTQ
ncbi:hypothetical protein [Pontixanthobacter sp.]|uniref:hypothetical protein n=1 Tax=Pontixanthobacter sp. TaxID=2792078 RepID=UPI003C7C6BC4